MGQQRCQGGLLYLGSTRAHSLRDLSSKPDGHHRTEIPSFQMKAMVKDEPKIPSLTAPFNLCAFSGTFIAFSDQQTPALQKLWQPS